MVATNVESGLNVMIMALSLDINLYCDSHSTSIIKLKQKFTCIHLIFCFLYCGPFVMNDSGVIYNF